MPDIESTFRPRLAGSGPFLPESGLVTSVFGRVGDVEGEPGDYSSSEIGNASGVPGFSVSDALDVLALLASGASPQLSQVVSVSNSGNDTTGTGSSPEPFATVPAAMDAIAGFGDASPTKRYAVVLAPGNYPANFDLPANVFLVGMQREATRITAPIITLDATWSPAGDHRSGLQNLIITGGPKSFNFIPPASNEGKLFFRKLRVQPNPVVVVVLGDQPSHLRRLHLLCWLHSEQLQLRLHQHRHLERRRDSDQRRTGALDDRKFLRRRLRWKCERPSGPHGATTRPGRACRLPGGEGSNLHHQRRGRRREREPGLSAIVDHSARRRRQSSPRDHRREGRQRSSDFSHAGASSCRARHQLHHLKPEDPCLM